MLENVKGFFGFAKILPREYNQYLNIRKNSGCIDVYWLGFSNFGSTKM